MFIVANVIRLWTWDRQDYYCVCFGIKNYYFSYEVVNYIQLHTLLFYFHIPLPSFPSSSLSTKDIEARNESLALFDTLKCNPQAFYNHMTKYVLPTVEGTDMGRLLYYYTLLDAAGCEHYFTTTIKPDSHVKLLKKLRAVANGEMNTVSFLFPCYCNSDGTATA